MTLKSLNSVKIDFTILNCDDGTNNGRIKALITTKDSIYTYKWATGDSILNNLIAGQKYAVTITKNNCQVAESVVMKSCNTTPTIDRDETVKIYPNPVSDKIFIESPFNIQKVEIFDVTGTIIAIFKEKNMKEIPLSMLHAGSYFMKLYFEKRIGIKRFMKL